MLWHFWHEGRADNLITRQESQLAHNAVDAGYAFVGYDGVVLRHAVPGTAALRQYWGAARQDHFATATANGAADAVRAGYTLLPTIEGNVFSSAQTGAQPMRLFFHAGRGDNFTTVERASTAVGYGEGQVQGHAFASGF